MRRAATWLARRQNRDGGFSFSGRGASGDRRHRRSGHGARHRARARRAQRPARRGLARPQAEPRRRLRAAAPRRLERAVRGARRPGPARRGPRSRPASAAAARARRSPSCARSSRPNGLVRYSRTSTQTPVWVDALQALAAPRPQRPLPVRGWLGSATDATRRPEGDRAGEHRVALVPDIVRKLTARGIEVLVRAGAGDGALIPDAAFADAGAQLSDDQAAVWGADVVVTIAPPAPADIARMRAGALLVGFLQPLTSAATGRRRARREGHCARDGGDPAHLARAGDGRALQSVERRRLRGGRCSPPSTCSASSRC